MERSLVQRLVAELVGTFALIFVGVASILAAGVAPGAGLITVALAHGLTIAVMVTAVGHISGGHFNPAVTFGALVTGNISVRDAAAYIATQLAGGILGALTIRVAFPSSLWQQGALGTPTVAPGIAPGQAVIIEAVLTFFLVWVVFATAVDPEGAFAKVAGMAIGFTIALDIMAGGPFTGASMNPARTLGPAVAGGPWAGHWVYWVGPLLGGAAAAALYDLTMLRRRDRRQVAAEELGADR
ncbi:MAG: aquaporin [Actinomycetota bacterium]|nr:aquaporin [Actinomycetota bacterium]